MRSVYMRSLILSVSLCSLIGIGVAHSLEPFSRDRVKQFEEINRAFDSGDFSVALAILAQIRTNTDLNAMEKAYVSNYMGNIHFSLGDFHLARDEFLKILLLEKHLPPSFLRQVIYVVGQVEFSLRNYYEAIKYFNRNLDEAGADTPKAFMMLAQSYYFTQQYCQAYAYIRDVSEDQIIGDFKIETHRSLLRAIKQNADSETLDECVREKE